MLDKADKFWMELFHENKGKHRKFLTNLLKNDNQNVLSLDIAQGISNVKEDLVCFIVENKVWYEEQPQVLRERFLLKLDKLYRNITSRTCNIRVDPPKIVPFDNNKFNMQNKINQFNRANKSPQYNSRNLV